MDNILIVIPTYNESTNISILIKNIFNKNIKFKILIVDDSSTDGTLETIHNLKKNYENLFLLQRPKKMGIGTAHIDGIKWAYLNNYTKVITMDGDLTHSADKIADFIEQGKNFDLVVGSRFLEKNSLKDWDFHRKLLTYLGHFCTKFLLKIDYDATGGFRFYNLNKIPILLFDKVESKNYSFFIESIFIIHSNCFSIGEVPIKLPKRTYGSSKMTIINIFQSLNLLVKLFFLKMLNLKKILINK
jgi:dolichol-phosphate mannosyltransferase